MARDKQRFRGMGIASGWVAGNPTDDPQNRRLPAGTISAAVATSAASVDAAQPVRLLAATDPIAGTSTVLGGAQWTQLCYYRTVGGVPRKGTVVVAPNQITQVNSGTSFSTTQGLYVRITYGTERGRVQQIVGAPCEFPVEGSYVQVEGMIGNLPYQLGLAGAFSQTTFDPNFQCKATAMVIDGWTSEGAPILFAQDVACNTPFPQVPLGGIKGGRPAIIDLIELTNTNASATVKMTVADGIVGFPGNVGFSTYVPAQTSVTLARRMLGAYFSGLSIYAIGDANGANVLATVWGRYLLQGSP